MLRFSTRAFSSTVTALQPAAAVDGDTAAAQEGLAAAAVTCASCLRHTLTSGTRTSAFGGGNMLQAVREVAGSIPQVTGYFK